MTFFEKLERELPLRKRLGIKIHRLLSWVFLPGLSWKAAWSRPYVPGLGFLGSIETPDEKISFE